MCYKRVVLFPHKELFDRVTFMHSLSEVGRKCIRLLLVGVSSSSLLLHISLGHLSFMSLAHLLYVHNTYSLSYAIYI